MVFWPLQFCTPEVEGCALLHLLCSVNPEDICHYHLYYTLYRLVYLIDFLELVLLRICLVMVLNAIQNSTAPAAGDVLVLLVGDWYEVYQTSKWVS